MEAPLSFKAGPACVCFVAQKNSTEAKNEFSPLLSDTEPHLQDEMLAKADINRHISSISTVNQDEGKKILWCHHDEMNFFAQRANVMFKL